MINKVLILMLKSSKLVFLPRKAAQNTFSPVSHRKKKTKNIKEKKRVLPIMKIENNN